MKKKNPGHPPHIPPLPYTLGHARLYSVVPLALDLPPPPKPKSWTLTCAVVAQSPGVFFTEILHAGRGIAMTLQAWPIMMSL